MLEEKTKTLDGAAKYLPIFLIEDVSKDETMWTATHPALDRCATRAKTPEEALRQLALCRREWLGQNGDMNLETEKQTQPQIIIVSLDKDELGDEKKKTRISNGQEFGVEPSALGLSESSQPSQGVPRGRARIKI